MTKVLLKAKDLCKSYATDGLQTHVISHMDLEINESDFTVIEESAKHKREVILGECIAAEDVNGEFSMGYEDDSLLCASLIN